MSDQEPSESNVPVPINAPEGELAAASEVGRRGQLQAERARFDLGPQQRVLGEALGELPPGYGMTQLSVWVRDPQHVVAVWDINGEKEEQLAEQYGWQHVTLRLIDERGAVLRSISVASRSGIWHMSLRDAQRPVRAAIGLLRPDGMFMTLSRTAPIVMPPNEGREEGSYETVRLPFRLDRRALLRSEPPPRPGYQLGGQESPAWRLHHRLRVALWVTPQEQVTGPFHGEWNPGDGPPARHLRASREGGEQPGNDAEGGSTSTEEAVARRRLHNSSSTLATIAPAPQSRTRSALAPRATRTMAPWIAGSIPAARPRATAATTPSLEPQQQRESSSEDRLVRSSERDGTTSHPSTSNLKPNPTSPRRGFSRHDQS